MRVAVLDDYQRAALDSADWSPVSSRARVVVFDRPFAGEDEAAEALRDFEIVSAMRERTPFPSSLLTRLPKLKLLVTTGMRNAAIDMECARERGVVVCGTQSPGHATAELTWGLILSLARHIPLENASMRGGGWQTTLGTDLRGKTLGVIGLGRLGSQVAAVGKAFGMDVIAWSGNLTPDKAEAAGCRYLPLDDLLKTADVITIHLQLGERSQGLIGRRELRLMKRSAFLVNTSRGPIVQEDALIEALTAGTIAGAALDVYDVEPLPADHSLRSLPNVVVTPHLGFVTRETYEVFYGQTVECIAAWLDGKPVRVLNS